MCVRVRADALWCAAGCGGKRPGSLPGAPWLSDLWRPLCTSSSSSMQQDVYSPLLIAQPRRTETGVASMMLTLPQAHCKLRLQTVTPLCCWTFLPLQSNFMPTREGKKPAVAVKLTIGGGSFFVSPLSNSSLYVFYLTDGFVLVDSRYWKCRVRLYSQQPPSLFDS